MSSHTEITDSLLVCGSHSDIHSQLCKYAVGLFSLTWLHWKKNTVISAIFLMYIHVLLIHHYTTQTRLSLKASAVIKYLLHAVPSLPQMISWQWLWLLFMMDSVFVSLRMLGLVHQTISFAVHFMPKVTTWWKTAGLLPTKKNIIQKSGFKRKFTFVYCTLNTGLLDALKSRHVNICRGNTLHWSHLNE